MMKKRIKLVLRVLLMGVMSITLGLAVYNWNSTTLLGKSIPMPLGYGGAVVLSGSMEPALSVDDLIIIHETNDYRENDVIVFEKDGIVVVHRIVGIDGESYITKGDANNANDDPITLKHIVGEVIFVVPGIGGLVSVIKSPVGIVSILCISFLLLEFSYRKDKEEAKQSIEDIKEEIRRLKEEM